MASHRGDVVEPLVGWPTVALLFALVVAALVGPFELAALTRGYIFPAPAAAHAGRSAGVPAPFAGPTRRLP